MENDAVPNRFPVNDPVNELETCDGVIFPKTIVIDGCVVEDATIPLIPFAVATDTFVTEPVADAAEVGAHEALTEFRTYEAVSASKAFRATFAIIASDAVSEISEKRACEEVIDSCAVSDVLE